MIIKVYIKRNRYDLEPSIEMQGEPLRGDTIEIDGKEFLVDARKWSGNELMIIVIPSNNGVVKA